MDLTNKSELEQYFAENFDTVFFPILADLYRKEGDLSRARKVCEIGLEYHPNNIPGTFILGELYQKQGNLEEAEKFYKNVLSINSWHYCAIINLVKIQTKLKRSEESIAKLWHKIIRINPTHAEAQKHLKVLLGRIKRNSGEQKIGSKIEPKLEGKSIKKLASQVKSEISDGIRKDRPQTPAGEKTEGEVQKLKQKLEVPKKKSSDDDLIEGMKAKSEEILSPKPPTIKPTKISEEDLQALDITPRMATFTMVNVLKRQKLYQQALYVLNMLEEKGADQALIDQERQTIQELLEKSESK